MHENAQKSEWKTPSKISCDFTELNSLVKIACLDDAFSEIFKLEASPGEGQSLLQQQKDKKRKKS